MHACAHAVRQEPAARALEHRLPCHPSPPPGPMAHTWYGRCSATTHAMPHVPLAVHVQVTAPACFYVRLHRRYGTSERLLPQDELQVRCRQLAS